MDVAAETLSVSVPNRETRSWLETEYSHLVQSAIHELNLPIQRVSYECAPSGAVRPAQVSSEILEPESLPSLNPKFTFDTFVVGTCNQFAHAAARAVATNPSRSYNPLFLYGGVGMGKTHLMHAIGRSLSDQYAGMRIIYTSSERFMNEMISCIRTDRMQQFHQRYREADALLVDDIQLLGNKERTQEEFFHTFNSLYEKQKQIVLSSDRPPMEISDITDRLRSRFSMGLIADIQPPEIETKIAILYKKAEAEKLLVPEEVAYFIASKVKSNVRDLEGCLIKLGAHSSLTGMPIDMNLAKNVLKDLISEEDKPVTADLVIKTVCELFGLKQTEIKSRKRTKEVANARQVGMYVTKQMTQLSLSEIGRFFGGKDHATVIYACNQVEEKRQKDDNLNKIIETITRRLTS